MSGFSILLYAVIIGGIGYKNFLRRSFCIMNSRESICKDIAKNINCATVMNKTNKYFTDGYSGFVTITPEGTDV